MADIINNDFSDFDSFLFHEGTDYEAYKKLGAHICDAGKEHGTMFRLWAPGAKNAWVICAATGWENYIEMQPGENGIWEVFIANVCEGDAYRYIIRGADDVFRSKSDPYAFRSEMRPATASIVARLDSYTWGDGSWMASRNNTKVREEPMSIYEVHLGSWKKDYSYSPDGFLGYRELAHQLAEYVNYMGYTHVELMGICEYPYDGSWGYQVTGYFSPTARHGIPDDFRYFVDHLHQNGIGVILDWVPAHFPKDSFSLEKFDGTSLYEPEDPLMAEYPEWGTYAFDHAKPEVRSFLISSAFYWIREFHIDALRVDAVAAMFYSSFSRTSWRLNALGGNENLAGMEFLRQLNNAVRTQTDAYLIAEDSSIVKGVTADVSEGGYGFMFKWNMGWMNDTLHYMSKDPIFRKWHHGELTYVFDYAFTENFVLVLSHDEVVHLKRSMVEKFPGSMPDKLGGLKAYYTLQYTHPGKKLLFMGQDFAQEREWDEDREIDWFLTEDFGHRDVMNTLRSLIKVYKEHSCLYTDTLDERTFEWVNRNDSDRNILSYIRRNPWNYEGALLVVCNFAPQTYVDYTCGVPGANDCIRIFSTYDSLPGCGGPEELGALPVIRPQKHPCDGRDYMLTYTLRPYEAVIFDISGGK